MMKKQHSNGTYYIGCHITEETHKKVLAEEEKGVSQTRMIRQGLKLYFESKKEK